MSFAPFTDSTANPDGSGIHPKRGQVVSLTLSLNEEEL